MKNITCIFCSNNHDNKFVSTPTQSGFTCFTCYDLIRQEQDLQKPDCGLFGFVKACIAFFISLYGSIIAFAFMISFPIISFTVIVICFMAQQYFYKRNVAWFTNR